MSFYEGITPIESYDLGMGLEPEKRDPTFGRGLVFTVWKTITELTGISPFSIGKIIFIKVHFSASELLVYQSVNQISSFSIGK